MFFTLFWGRQKWALLILSNYKKYLQITGIWVHQVHILHRDRVHICTHFSIMLFTATSYFMIKHALKMIYLKYMHILKKMGTDVYPVFYVFWVLNVLAQVENVLAQVVNYFWHLIPRFHCTSHTHKINLRVLNKSNGFSWYGIESMILKFSMSFKCSYEFRMMKITLKTVLGIVPRTCKQYQENHV